MPETQERPIRNPGVPENFIELVGTFRDQLHGRSVWKSPIEPAMARSILVLEEVIKEQGAALYLDEFYRNLATDLSRNTDLSTNELDNEVAKNLRELDRLKTSLHELVSSPRHSQLIQSQDVDYLNQLRCINLEIKIIEQANNLYQRTLDARKSFITEDGWMTALERFRTMEREIYIRWGQIMIERGYEDRFLEFGREEGYF